MKKMRKCPKCGSTIVAPILYGMPAYNEEMEKQLEQKKLYLGGCMISETAPQWHCFGCSKDVGTPPVVVGKNGFEDYRDIVKGIRFTDGGYFGGIDEVWIRKNESEIVVDYEPSFRNQKRKLPSRCNISEKEWNQILNRLYCWYYVHEWDHHYDNWEVLDGEQWSLKIYLTNKRVREYSGSNAFPAYWKEVLHMFQKYYGKEI